MGKTKTKVIDDSKLEVSRGEQVSQVPQEKKKTRGTPKDALAASLLEELNKEFGEVKEKESSIKELESSKEIAEKTKKIRKERKEAKKPEQKVKPRGKKYQEAISQVEKTKKYSLNEAVELVKKTSYSSFPGTVEIHINTNFKNIRGLVSLPFASGKKLTILAFGPTPQSYEGQVKDLEELGVIVGNDQTIEEIEKGKINFDVLVTTPEWMPKLAKVAKVLGPRGLMPNPKNGTITDDLKRAVSELQSGKVEYKTEKDNKVIHLGIGKTTQPQDEISANVKTLYNIIGPTKVKQITLSPTMGPGIKVDLGSI